ncbi:MAG: hypothetical protein EHM38_10075 [Geobacteraceae bacterium]|nr:MAG: hypothetical protein EHM38_10075 [Geobacteraceae bacterium]
MRKRSFAGVNRVPLPAVIGIFVLLATICTSPCQAVEPDRQVHPPLSPKTVSHKLNRLNKDVTFLDLHTVPGSMTETSLGQVVRSSVQFLPRWTRVMAMSETQLDAMNHCNPGQGSCPEEMLFWKKILQEARDLPFLEQLKSVNAYFNGWPYRRDIDAYGVSEYWASPLEFLQKSGDCEDYSIAKYFALKQLGVPVEQMSIVLLIDAVSDSQHAVLVVSNGQDSYVLDNLSDLLLPQEKYAHYLPLYSVNEHYRWTYVTTSRLN